MDAKIPAHPAADDDAEPAEQKFRKLLVRLLQWDHLNSAGDGPYWRQQIEEVLLD